MSEMFFQRFSQAKSLVYYCHVYNVISDYRTHYVYTYININTLSAVIYYV